MRSMQAIRSAIPLSIALLLPAGAAHAQQPPNDTLAIVDARSDTSARLARLWRRFSGQFDVVQMRPTGDLAHNIGLGYGIDAAASMRLGGSGIVALRAELGLAQYGSEHETVPLSPTTGRILVDVTTTNDVFTGGLGLQLMAPAGAIRPYVSGSAGFVSFVTESQVGGNSDTQPFASTINHQDTGFSWLAGGGIYVPIHRGRQLVSVNIGATYHATQGRRSYLKPGSIHDLPNGGIAIDPMYSEARFVTWRVGVRVGG